MLFPVPAKQKKLRHSGPDLYLTYYLTYAVQKSKLTHFCVSDSSEINDTGSLQLRLQLWLRNVVHKQTTVVHKIVEVQNLKKVHYLDNLRYILPCGEHQRYNNLL
jgi:hypothetical protein